MEIVIIYPQGNGGNANPHVVFDDGTNKLQFNVTNSLVLSSSTVSSGVTISPSGIIVSGASVSDGVFVGPTQMINSSAVWVGP